MKRLALLRIAWITLHRDRLGLLLYALVPIIFLSIFASVFQGFGRNGDNQVRIALLDLDRSPASKALEAAVKESSNRVNLETIQGADVAAADRQVASGAFPAAVIIPSGFGTALADPTANDSAAAGSIRSRQPDRAGLCQGCAGRGDLEGVSAADARS